MAYYQISDFGSPPDNYAWLKSDFVSQALIQGLRRDSALMSVSNIQPTDAQAVTIPVFIGGMTVGPVAEGAVKPTTKATASSLDIAVKKWAGIIPFTDETLRFARQDPTQLITQDMLKAFPYAYDAHGLGYSAGTPITSTFSNNLGACTQTLELPASPGDVFATTVSQAMALLRANGYQADAVVASSDIEGYLRDQRKSFDVTSPVYTEGYSAAPTEIYGLPIVYTSNLSAFPAGTGKVAAFVGAFKTNSLFKEALQITVDVDDRSAITLGGVLTSMWESNLTALRFESFLGYAPFDLNRAFVKITNAV